MKIKSFAQKMTNFDIICSQFYCLDAYRTLNPNDESDEPMEPSLDAAAADAWFTILIQQQWDKINMIDFNNPGESDKL